QQGAAAAIVRAYAGRIIRDFALDRALEGRAGARLVSGERRAPPTPGTPRLAISTRGWYNPLRDYQDYMVPGILVALVTIISALLSAQNIAREKEIGTLEQLNVTPLTRSQFIAGKLAPFWVLALFEFCLGLVIARLVFDVPLRGSVPLVIAVAALYLLTTLGIGLWISTVADTQQQANFVAFFVLVIYLLMSGLFTPVDSMPRALQLAAELNPLKHFVEVMRVVLVKGAGPEAIAVPVLALTAFAAVTLTGATLRYRKTTG
ncbi:MAG: ABC transporter permease, partial [Longimicrobiales bacterium]